MAEIGKEAWVWLALTPGETPSCGLQGVVAVEVCLGVPEDDDRDDGGGQEEQVEAEEQGVHHVAELHPQANQMLLLSLVFLLGPS